MSFSGGGRRAGMRRVDAQREADGRKSQLSGSLKVYLNNGDRLQPIIGLGSIVECGTANTDLEALYLCEVCELRLGKADMRNHIMGSLHRYNYIRARYPHLVSEWKDDGDLYKLAWPLMEKAKELESEEGPGDIQVFQVDDALYQRIHSSSVKHAMALVNIVKDSDKSQPGAEGTEPGSTSPQWNSTMRFRGNQQVAYGGPVAALTQEEDFFRLPVAPPLHDEPMLSEISCSPQDADSHLFGLCRVLECKNQEGQTRFFLCHCCCLRTNEGDVSFHFSSSSHLINYLMESRPEQMQALMPGITNDKLSLQTLAQEVEDEEGRGRPEVVTLPESLCRLMSGKSYDWCVQALNKAPACSSHYHKKLNGKGPATNKSRGCNGPYKRAEKRWNRRKATSNNTVFKVSLPLTEGSVLLQRTSFSRDRVPLSTEYEPPPSNSPPHHWAEVEEHPEDSELPCGEEEGWFDLQARQEDPTGRAADGDFVQAVRPNSLRVATVLSSLVNYERGDDGSEEEQNWRINRTVWQDEPPQMQSGYNGAGRPLPRSHSEPANEFWWDGGPEHTGGPSAGMSNNPNLEETSGQALCYCQQYQYMTPGGAAVQQATPCSDANNFYADSPYWCPRAAMGSTAAEPQPVNNDHQWKSVMSFMPIGPYQAASQGHTMPAATWGPGREMTPDRASQIGYTPYTAQELCHSHHAVMWT